VSDTPIHVQPPARPAVFGLRTAALAGLLVATAALPPTADAATGPRGVFTDAVSAYGCPPFPTCCGTNDK